MFGCKPENRLKNIFIVFGSNLKMLYEHHQKSPPPSLHPAKISIHNSKIISQIPNSKNSHQLKPKEGRH
jgi:hypothetical protein